MNTQSTLTALVLSVGVLMAPANAQAKRTSTLEFLRLPSVAVTPVTGTPAMYQPGVRIANLDAGNYVAGLTYWQVGEIIFLETRVGFLWTEAAGSIVFEVPPSVYFNRHIQVPAQIADNGTVVGTAIFTNDLSSLPFRWKAATGFEFLDVSATGWSGVGLAVSADGSRVAGAVRGPGLAALPLAARWNDTVLEVFGQPGRSSGVFALSSDGTISVGESSSDPANPTASRWIGTVEVGLDSVPGAVSTTARFVSADGQWTVGWATLRGGEDVLVRWAGDGSATVLTPPSGLALKSVAAINPTATAIVGALTDGVLFQENQTPFVWRLGSGFTAIGELGADEVYDRSYAIDVSDDGQSVVGKLALSVTTGGSPPSIGFLWTPSKGTQDLKLLLEQGGGPPLFLFEPSGISGDGKRILITGTEAPSVNDTAAVIFDLDRPTVILDLN
jgi:hypothetical protein